MFSVVRRGKIERSSNAQETPIAKAVYSFLQEKMPSSFSFPAWNNGRIVCQRSQLKQILTGIESSSDGSKDKIVPLTNSFPLHGTRMSTGDLTSVQPNNNSEADKAIGTRAELMTSTV